MLERAISIIRPSSLVMPLRMMAEVPTWYSTAVSMGLIYTNRSSSWCSSGRSGRILMASLVNLVPKGSRRMVVVTLNKVCILAIWAEGLSVKDIIQLVRGVVMHSMVNTQVPMMLNIRWMMVVRLALRLVPMAASTAVMQVPMFWPNST